MLRRLQSSQNGATWTCAGAHGYRPHHALRAMRRTATLHWDPLLLRETTTQPPTWTRTENPRRYPENELLYLRNKYWVRLEASKAESQSNRRVDTKPANGTQEASTGSKDQTEGKTTQVAPTDGPQIPNFGNAWNKQAVRKQFGKMGRYGEATESGRRHVTTRTVRRYGDNKSCAYFKQKEAIQSQLGTIPIIASLCNSDPHARSNTKCTAVSKPSGTPIITPKNVQKPLTTHSIGHPHLLHNAGLSGKGPIGEITASSSPISFHKII